MLRSLAVAGILLASASGCAVLAGKEEYRDYRTVRLSEDDHARLLAMQRYLAQHPEGRWSDEIRTERKARDLEVFEAGKATRDGLTFYLRAYPDGVFATQARARLEAIEQIERQKRADAGAARLLAEDRLRRDAELRRTWVSRFAKHWASTLMSLSGWGRKIEDLAKANPDFSRAFGQAPRPRCSSDECVKHYESPYALPVPSGTRIERVMRVVLRLRMQAGKVKRAELLLPSWGFSRWRELEGQRAVIDGDAEDRSGAVKWAFEQLLAALDPQTARTPDAKYVLAEIPPPAIGPSGEGTDTTAADPGAPVTRANVEAAPAPVAEDPSTWTKPEAPAAPADMELEAVRIDQKGHAIKGEMALEPVAITLENVTVPAGQTGQAGQAGQAGQSAQGGQSASTPAAGPVLTVTPPRVEAFRVGALRVVLFAAASDARMPAYDGIVIELP